jgi:beta-galactosidase/beta-glucuronidase
LLNGAKPVHTITERFGFRTFEVRKGDGLYLNGQRILLKGVNRHSFWPETGRALSKQISYDDVKLIKEMNMNAVRMSHYPPDAHFLEACDELGLYVLDELGGSSFIRHAYRATFDRANDPS